MMYGIFKSRMRTINWLNTVRSKLFEEVNLENNKIILNYPNEKNIKNTLLVTYLAFSIYPLSIIFITFWIYKLI